MLTENKNKSIIGAVCKCSHLKRKEAVMDRWKQEELQQTRKVREVAHVFQLLSSHETQPAVC